MIVFQSSALYLTDTVKMWLARSRRPRVLHVFEEACNLSNEMGQVISVVAPRIGRGPLHLVLEEPFRFPEVIEVDSQIRITTDRLTVGNLAVSTDDASTWEPRPNWEYLHDNLENITSQLIPFQIPAEPFASQLGTSLASLNRDTSLREAAKLAGLGPGLTPSGDDFILGALYAAWMIHPAASVQGLAGEIAHLSAARTTSLSAAYLRAAGNGEAGIRWHNFFDALISQDTDLVIDSFDEILSIGATSGADALAGFFSTLVSWMESNIIACQS